MAYNAAFDICKEITDSSSHDGKTAADEACNQAFKALDKIKLNTCHGWRNAGCRLAHRGDQYRQCTCLNPDRSSYTATTFLVISFRDCAPELWTQELSTGEVPAPTTNFKKLRLHYDDALNAAASRRAKSYSGSFSGSYGGGSSVHGAGGSSGYVYPSSEHLSYAPGWSSAELAKPYVCIDCGFKSRSARGLYYHKKFQHTVTDTHCHMCNLTFKNIKAFEAHLRQEHPEITDDFGIEPERAVLRDLLRYRCQYCGKGYSAYYSLLDHLKSHTTDDTKCRVCHKTLSTKKGLKNHMEYQHPDVPWTEQRKAADQAEVEKILPYSCHFCGNKYNSQNGLADHLISHTTADTKCRVCPKAFSTKAGLKNHMKNAHPDVPLTEPGDEEPKANRFACDQCDKSYALKSGLRDHKKSHQTTDTHCIYCNRTLSTKTNYNKHMKRRHPSAAAAEAEEANRQYIAANPEECEICKKRFKNERGLREHMDSHDGITTCDDCGLVLPRLSSLYQHQRKEHHQ